MALVGGLKASLCINNNLRAHNNGTFLLMQAGSRARLQFRPRCAYFFKTSFGGRKYRTSCWWGPLDRFTSCWRGGGWWCCRMSSTFRLCLFLVFWATFTTRRGTFSRKRVWSITFGGKRDIYFMYKLNHISYLCIFLSPTPHYPNGSWSPSRLGVLLIHPPNYSSKQTGILPYDLPYGSVLTDFCSSFFC